jgi:hypothetical protein
MTRNASSQHVSLTPKVEVHHHHLQVVVAEDAAEVLAVPVIIEC